MKDGPQITQIDADLKQSKPGRAGLLANIRDIFASKLASILAFGWMIVVLNLRESAKSAGFNLRQSA